MSRPEASAVRAHYQGLAASYAARENKACKRAYWALAAEHLKGCARIVEVGCGASGLRGAVPGAEFVGCDLTHAMLAAGESRRVVAADGAALPMPDEAFDGAVCVNVLEHTPAPAALIVEMTRVLRPGGRLLVITPNGARKIALEWLERLRLKLPEGPHRFLAPRELAAAVPPSLSTTWHGPTLAVPAGPGAWVRAVDRALGRWGLFQALAARKVDTPPSGQALRR